MVRDFKIEEHKGSNEPDWASIENPFLSPTIGEANDRSSIEGTATYPKDSILESWMQFARKNCENSDFQLLGTILPVCGAIMERKVYMDFFGHKFPNLYCMIVAAPGQRKSTLIKFARNLAIRVVNQSRFIDSVTSEEALFDQFDPEKNGNPDQFLIEDEGNTLFTNWSETSYGKLVSKRFLSLYDCTAWNQSFKGNKTSEDGSSKRSIPQTSANLLVGSTYNICRMNKLEVRDGMWRRFLKYPAEGLARKIYFSERIDGGDWNDLAMLFEQLRPDSEKPRECVLSCEAEELYKDLKDENQKKANEIPNDLNPANEAKASVLSEEMSFTMKIAMIFECCRWTTWWKEQPKCIIQADTLKMAYDHVQECNMASDALESIGRRSEIRDAADTILANVLGDFEHLEVEGFIPVTKTQLTNRFCRNGGRRGGMNNYKLYHEMIPDLESRGLVAKHPIKGTKKVFYLFNTEE